MQKTNPRLHLYKLGLLSCEWVYSWLDGSAIMSLVGVDQDLAELITAVLTHAGKGQVGRALANFQLSQ